MLKKWFLLLFAPVLLLADSEVVPVAPTHEDVAPWFTGSLLAAAATVVPVGHWDIEPYIYYTNTTARYDRDWKVINEPNLQEVAFIPYFWVGLTEWLDLQVNPAWAWNYRDGPAHWVLNDSVVKIDIQLYLDQIPSKSWLPSIKLGFQETLPTGKYQNLKVDKQYTDQGGLGAWTSTFELAFGKIIHIHKDHWMQFRFNIDYSISSSVHVKGLNSYGGGIGTNGIVRPGQMFSFTFGTEYSLTRNWVLACDFYGVYEGKGGFRGESGRNIDGTPVISTFEAAMQYSLAPAIEYNFSDSLGIIAGSWFTIAGKNSTKFCNATIAINYYYQ